MITIILSCSVSNCTITKKAQHRQDIIQTKCGGRGRQQGRKVVGRWWCEGRKVCVGSGRGGGRRAGRSRQEVWGKVVWGSVREVRSRRMAEYGGSILCMGEGGRWGGKAETLCRQHKNKNFQGRSSHGTRKNASPTQTVP